MRIKQAKSSKYLRYMHKLFLLLILIFIFCGSTFACDINDPSYVSWSYHSYIKPNYNEAGNVISHGLAKMPHTKNNCDACDLESRWDHGKYKDKHA